MCASIGEHSDVVRCRGAVIYCFILQAPDGGYRDLDDIADEEDGLFIPPGRGCTIYDTATPDLNTTPDTYGLNAGADIYDNTTPDIYDTATREKNGIPDTDFLDVSCFLIRKCVSGSCMVSFFFFCPQLFPIRSTGTGWTNCSAPTFTRGPHTACCS